MTGGKRKGGGQGGQGGRGYKKRGKFHHNPGNAHHSSLTGIENHSQGIMVTCDLGREPRAVDELNRLFEEYIEELYGPEDSTNDDEDDNNTEKAAAENGGSASDNRDSEGLDLEAEIENELNGLKRPIRTRKRKRFFSVKLDTQCLAFFQTRPPVDPTELVTAICKRSLESGKKQTRYTQRLTPITRTGKANLDDIEELARAVLKPHFHEGQEGVKFAIRPCTRNCSTLSRDDVIKRIASVVGQKHRVDLKNYDVLILVEIYKNMCGMSVVRDFEKYKRFNLVQIHESTLKRAEGKNLDEANVKPEQAETLA